MLSSSLSTSDHQQSCIAQYASQCGDGEGSSLFAATAPPFLHRLRPPHLRSCSAELGCLHLNAASHRYWSSSRRPPSSELAPTGRKKGANSLQRRPDCIHTNTLFTCAFEGSEMGLDLAAEEKSLMQCWNIAIPTQTCHTAGVKVFAAQCPR
jgi:hypothetical protein